MSKKDSTKNPGQKKKKKVTENVTFRPCEVTAKKSKTLHLKVGGGGVGREDQ